MKETREDNRQHDLFFFNTLHFVQSTRYREGKRPCLLDHILLKLHQPEQLFTLQQKYSMLHSQLFTESCHCVRAISHSSCTSVV